MVSDEHDRGPAGAAHQALEISQQPLAPREVEARQRLVEQQQPGVGDEAPGDLHPLPFALRQRAARPLGEVFGAHLRERAPRPCSRSGVALDLDHRGEIADRWQIWHAEKARRRGETRGKGMNAATVFDALSRLSPENSIVCVDVGNNAYSLGRYWETRGHTFLMSGYLGSIGFAMPAALGAWAATQEEDPRFAGRKVISVSGDGGFAQYMAEFTTAVKYGMSITHVVLNDTELGKISKEQRTGFWDVWQTSLVNPDFAAFADSCGGLGIAVHDAADLDAALERAMAHEGASLVEIHTDAMLL